MDDGNYSVSPLTCVHFLLKQVFDRKLQCSSETPQAEFEWWTGGAMQKFASKPIKEAAMAQISVSAHLHTDTELQFVYGIAYV